ncbi:MAG: hypothetical protein ACRELX_18565 [Longimicrobiales bacterium]
MVRSLVARNRAGSRAGFSLVEALVGLAVVAVAVLSVGGAADAAARLLRDAALAQGAALEAEAMLDSLAAAGVVGGGVLSRGPYTMSWTAADSSGLGFLELFVQYTSGGAVQRFGFGRRTASTPVRDTSAY